jgi:UDP-N-acetylmuramoyl-tripeptide--D-alanyl-D-alanine ligase
VAVLGEMLELGDESLTLHERVGRAAARVGVDVLLAVGGPPAAAMAAAARDGGLDPDQIHYFDSSEDAAEAAAALVARGDVVLVKGSRGVQTDRVVDRLKGAFS